jgi:DNA polymerase-3 subunit epsilon
MDKYTGAGFSKSGAVQGIFGYGSPNLDADVAAPFVVIDFETSGTSPDKGRVIEVAAITLSDAGEVIEEYSTLINPGDGQVGMSMIHHIVPRMVEDAPTFEEIADDLMSRLIGKVVVSHNASFEEKFLSAELKRVGKKVETLRALDTLQFIPRFVNLPDYKQSTLVRHFGIETDEHTALGDTRGLAKVLGNFLNEARDLGYPVALAEFVPISSNARLFQRTTNLKKGDAGWMANLLPKLPVTSFAASDFDRYSYWNLLADVLADGKITGDEIKQVAILAGRSGLSQGDVERLNQEFMQQQVALAEEDGVVTKEERLHLEKISQALKAAVEGS